MDTIQHPIDERSPAKRSLGLTLAYIMLFFLLGVIAWRMSQNTGEPINEGLAPDFSLTDFNGQTIILSELRGQVVVINFWASWCLPCRDEAPYLEKTSQKYEDQGVVFIGIDYLDTESEALAYIEEFEITYFNGPDLRTDISQDYNIQGIPETFVIDQNGEIRYVHIGPLFSPTLDQKIEMLLAESE